MTPAAAATREEIAIATVEHYRKFDVDTVLDTAVLLFWKHGYEGTSLNLLTAEMGISRPALYAAFHSKQRLFELALDRYQAGEPVSTAASLRFPTAREVVTAWLHRNVDNFTNPGHPPGSLTVQSALACSPANPEISARLAKTRWTWERALRRRLERAQNDGDPTLRLPPADLAALIVTVTHGLAVQAVDGASNEILHRVADLTLRAL